VPFNLSLTHMVVVGIVALVVLGPERLPGVARTAGNLYREWKRISGGLQAEVRDVLSEFTEPFSEPINDLRSTIQPMVSGTTSAGPGPASDSSEPTSGSGPVIVSPLTPAIPALGPSTGLVSPGPRIERHLTELGPMPTPDTFVPFTPGGAGGETAG
jgi:sec-independent protein translocase protein TatB